MMFLTVSGYVYFFAPNIVQSIFYSEQSSLFDARDINKSKHTYFYKSSVTFIYSGVSISFSGPFYPRRVVHITQKFWGNMDHPVGMYFSLLHNVDIQKFNIKYLVYKVQMHTGAIS